MSLSFPRIETWGLVGQGHALSGSSASRFSVRNNPWLLRGLRHRAQKATGRAWPCPTIGPVPEVRKLSGIASRCATRSRNASRRVNVLGCQGLARTRLHFASAPFTDQNVNRR